MVFCLNYQLKCDIFIALFWEVTSDDIRNIWLLSLSINPIKKSYFIPMKLFFLLCVLSITLLYANDHNLTLVSENNQSLVESSYIDLYHGYLDGKVREWGVDIDGAVLNFYNLFSDKNDSEVFEDKSDLFFLDVNSSYYGPYVDSNVSVGPIVDENNQSLVKKLKRDIVVEEKESADEFFLTRKFLEERDRSFVRVSYAQKYNSLESDPNSFTVRARLSLGRSKKRLKLFIEDFNEDSAKNIGTSGEDTSPSIGVDVFSKTRFGIRPKYSIGFRGIDPFVRARFSYKTNFGRWKFEPVQTFTETFETRYSFKDIFSETTEFYLDTATSESTLLRFVLDRGTESRIDGMRYDGFVQWFWNPREHAGLSLSLGFNGSTKYENTVVYTDPPVIKEENRVYNYLFSIRWRENIWKKWLFYEIAPGVNYHEQHDYRPNYNIYFGLDLFFGHV